MMLIFFLNHIKTVNQKCIYLAISEKVLFVKIIPECTIKYYALVFLFLVIIRVKFISINFTPIGINLLSME